MKKISVCIISAQLAPNYLFLQETKELADEVLLIASKGFEDKAKRLHDLIKPLNYKNIEVLTFSEKDVEEKWNQMVSEIEKRLDKQNRYFVNLTGGTKYMSLAVQKVFEDYKSDFFYIPSPKNYFIKPMRDDTKVTIKHRIKVKEGLGIFGVEVKSAETDIVDCDYTNKYFGMFIEGRLDFGVIEELRKFRRKKHVLIESVNNLSKFLKHSEFSPKNEGSLSRKEVEYLTGGWFEEYIYNHIKEYVKPDDILLNLAITKAAKTGGSNNINEFDVCFTLKNKFYVIECKTGGTDKKSDFNQIAYKAKALKETLMGLATEVYIFSLGPVHDRADEMGIKSFGREYFEDKDKFRALMQRLSGK